MKKMPGFRSEKEEAKFWDKNDVTDYIDQMTEIETPIKFSKALKIKLFSKRNKKLLTLRLEEGQIEAAKIVSKAFKRGTPPFNTFADVDYGRD
ncbi:CopG family antitoxin [Candidatus Margulisiibacteriota bacterium]